MNDCFICGKNSMTFTYLVEGKKQNVCSDCTSKLQEPIVRVLRIPSFNMPDLKDRFEKLARRAKRIGLPAPGSRLS